MLFADVLEIKNGRNQRAVENPNGAYPIYGSGGVMGYADDFICQAQTVVVGRKGNINKPLFVDVPFWNVDTAFGLEAKRSVLLPKYLYYFCLRYDFEKLNKAVTIPSLTKADLLKIEIELPKLSTQEDIVSQLESIERVISLHQHQLRTLDTLIKARFVEMFGDPFTGSSFGVKKLKEISISIADGSNVDKAYYAETGDVLFLRIQNVWFNEFRLDDSVFISDEVNRQYFDTSLHHGDLLITKIGRYYTSDSSLGRVSVYLGEDNRANYSNNIMRVRLADGVHSEFVNALMNLDDYNKHIRRVSVGGTDKRALSKAIIGDLPIIVPPYDLQMQFVDFVHQIDKSKVAVQKALDEAKLLFDSLMQKYFG